MNHPIARYAVLTLGVVLCVLVMIPALPYLASDRSVAGPGVVDAVNPKTAVFALALAVAAGAVIACVIGRLINAAVGMFVLGCGLAVLAGRSGTILDAAFDGDALLPLAVETAIWSVVAVAVSALVFRVSGPLIDMPVRTRGGAFVGEVFNRDAFRGIAVGLISVAILWLVDRTQLKGQAIGAAVAGGVLAAIAGRRVQDSAQPILLMAIPIFMVAIAQLFTALTFKGSLDQSIVVPGALPGWSRAMPLDIVAGTFVGVPIGLGWSKPAEE